MKRDDLDENDQHQQKNSDYFGGRGSFNPAVDDPAAAFGNR
jgi:hypothetical protein